MSLELKDLSVKQLVRQLWVLGAEVDPEQEWTKEELLSAVSKAVEGVTTSVVKVTKELLASEDLGSKLKELGFKKGEEVLVLGEAKKEPEKPVVPPPAAPPAPSVKLTWGPGKRVVRKVEDATTTRGEAVKRVVFTDCVELHSEEEVKANLNQE